MMFANRAGQLGGLRSGVTCLGYYAIGGAFRVENREFIVTTAAGETYRVVPGSSSLDLLLSTYPGRFTAAAFTGALLSDGRLLSDGGAGSLAANETYVTTRRGPCPAWAASFGVTAADPSPAPTTTTPAPDSTTTTQSPGTTTTPAPGAETTTTPAPGADPVPTTAAEPWPAYSPLGTEERREELDGTYPENGAAPAPTMTVAGPSIALSVALAGAAVFALLLTRDRRR